jgi:nicotinamide N-methyltransferase
LAQLRSGQRTHGFDVLILADLLFNHSEHGKLIQTVQETLQRKPDACALVFFTPYRPWLLEKDLAFFDLAKAGGFRVQKIFEKTMEKVLFEKDPGVCLCRIEVYLFFANFVKDELLRRTVFGYELRWNDQPSSDLEPTPLNERKS